LPGASDRDSALERRARVSSDAVLAMALLGLLFDARAVVSLGACRTLSRWGASSRAIRGSWVVRGVGGTLIAVLRGVDPMRLRGRRPPAVAGVVATVLLVAVCTVLVYPLKQVTTVSSLGVVLSAHKALNPILGVLMLSGASKSSKLRRFLDVLDALDGLDVVTLLSRGGSGARARRRYAR
jgi:hypothetical protein